VKTLFRADASNQIGTGHVMRCLTLADALQARGAECSFVCRPHTGNLLGVIRHASWLGASQQEDAAQTLQVARAMNADWIVVDHYALDRQWEREVRKACRKMMVIDDLADRHHLCDVLLDQNWFGEDATSRYDALIPSDCIRLLGPGHALLKPEYSALRSNLGFRNERIGRLLVFLGGSDPDNGTALVLSVLMQRQFRSLVADIVIGINHPDPAGIAEMVRARPCTSLHCGLPSLAPLMAEADLMVGGGGATTWERMCLGLPAIVISIADNQIQVNKALAAAGLIVYAGEIDTLREVDLYDALLYCFSNPDAMRLQSARIQELSPGNGTAGIAELLLQ
jgi:UDP-2,4-diacetamido-2,4,6-trideoxy-beta-L-altropyranose hydrolase